jgi:hypothetical protein
MMFRRDLLKLLCTVPFSTVFARLGKTDDKRGNTIISLDKKVDKYSPTYKEYGGGSGHIVCGLIVAPSLPFLSDDHDKELQNCIDTMRNSNDAINVYAVRGKKRFSVIASRKRLVRLGWMVTGLG